MRSCFLLVLLSLLAISSSQAQHAAGRWTLGLHGGADVSDDQTQKLLGAHLGVSIAPGTRTQLAVTTVIEEPGTTVFALLGAQWSPAPWRVQPYLGGGAGMSYREVGPFTQTDFGWMAQGGFRIPLRGITPFAEFRLIGITGTVSQILVGFENRSY